MTDLIAGRVAATLDGLAGPAARGGQAKLLAIASHARMTSRPDIATFSETLPGFTATGWWVLVAPSGTPEAIVKKVSDDLREVLARPDFRHRLEELGATTRPMSPQELATFIRGEQQLWKPVIAKAGLSAK